MIYFIEIIIYFIVLLNQLNGSVLLINDPSYIPSTSYTIISEQNRTKRDQSPRFFPEIDINQISCGHKVYIKLHTCSFLTECRTLSACLESLHCPLTVKSSGGLILNLLRLLGINKCNTNEQNQLCSNEKRTRILRNLSTRWTKSNDDNYCDTILNLMDDVKKEVQNQCPLNLKVVEAFLENYSCSIVKDSTNSSNPITNDDWESRLHSSEIEKILETFPTTSPSQIAYIDEDNDLKFINSNKDLFNNTEQNVYVNDHQYYNVSYIIPKSEGLPKYFVQHNKQFIRIHALSNRHRSAFGINLKFGFPFYGHTINRILVATGGFIYTGDLLHSALIGSTQYIASFMANFDASIGNNENEIKYYDNGTHFICTWNKLYLQDQQDAGPFTFQTILENTGNIYFNYLHIPKVNISNLNHAHRIGLSDAYMSQHSTNEHIVRVVTLYDKINLKKEKIQNGVSVVFEMDQTCNTFTDCSSCLANRGKRYNCSWCDDIQKCSDGYDRSRHQWIQAQCHRLAMEDTCPNSMEDVYNNNFPSPSIVHYEKRKESRKSSSPHHSIFQTFRTILITLLLSILILSLIALATTYIYAYRNPTSSTGIWLLEHRPSNYISRLKRWTSSN